MAKFIRNNLGNFFVIFVITILVFAGTLYYLSINTKGAEGQQIKILPTNYSGTWHNPGAALIQDLGSEAGFEEFNEENSAFPLEKRGIKEPAEIPTGSGIQAGEEETTISESEPLQEEITSPSEEIIGSESKSFEEETSSPSVDLEEVVPSIQEEVLSLSEPFEEIPTSPSESARVPYILGILLDLIVTESEELASESIEEIPTVSEEDIYVELVPLEEPIKSILEFSDFDVPPSFAKASEGKEEFKIKNVQLRLSMAVEGGGPQDSLIIEYSVGGETSYMDWQFLAEYFLSDPNSNATNGGYWLYGLPIFENWEDLSKLKIRFKYRGFLPDPMAPMGLENQPKGQVYLDALWLEVEYGGISDIKEKEKRISEEKIISEKSFDEFNVLKVEKENKKFELKFTLNNDFGESSLNFIADDSIIDLQSPIGSKFNYIFWLDKDKKGLYSFNIGTQAYNSISNNPGENNCLTFLDPASEKWQACYDETLNDFVFEPIIEITTIPETSSEILPEPEAPLKTSSPENPIENLIKDVRNLIEENLPKDLF